MCFIGLCLDSVQQCGAMCTGSFYMFPEGEVLSWTRNYFSKNMLHKQKAFIYEVYSISKHLYWAQPWLHEVFFYRNAQLYFDKKQYMASLYPALYLTHHHSSDFTSNISDSVWFEDAEMLLWTFNAKKKKRFTKKNLSRFEPTEPHVFL